MSAVALLALVSGATADAGHGDAVVDLTQDSFDAFVNKVPAGEYILIEFFACASSHAQNAPSALPRPSFSFLTNLLSTCNKGSAMSSFAASPCSGPGARSVSASSPSLRASLRL